MKGVEILNTKLTSISCSRDVPFDHPRVYLEIDKNVGFKNCPYCNKKFVLDNG